ncbi:Ger(x)C family spore germination protein [Bacillus sp. Marseille-Q3570]|uniref:Ger(x)C family spore germination protein n=1 Tax=Bacillus sp. Marseille-Q3570 TaxID=2963522 RepID=UPI0021B7BE21|nr:Ger(x)C family spore germination protein [Bacillus sp. Marseille-Q3570]
MKRYLLSWVMILLLLTGCWDQQMIKDARLVYATAFDLTDDDKIKATSAIRGFMAGGETGGGVPQNEVVQATGVNLRKTRINIDHELSNTFNPSKNRVFMYSTEIAEQGLYPFLDVFYRDPRSSLNSKLAVTEGEAGKILEMYRKGNTLIGEFVEEMIISGEDHTVVPRVDVQTVCPVFFNEGKDPYVPYIGFDEEKQEISLKGVALFDDDKMTGHLNADESKLLLLLHNKKRKIARYVQKVSDESEQEIENYLSFHIKKNKSKMTVTPLADSSITAAFNVYMAVNVIEYPHDDLMSKKHIDHLNKKLSTLMTKDANKVLEKLKEANSDPFGVGLELMAFHPEVWKKLDWKKEYPKIKMEAKVNVEIVDHGIIN